jgi:uncharacterized protein (UPF0262 family)
MQLIEQFDQEHADLGNGSDVELERQRVWIVVDVEVDTIHVVIDGDGRFHLSTPESNTLTFHIGFKIARADVPAILLDVVYPAIFRAVTNDKRLVCDRQTKPFPTERIFKREFQI